MRLFEPDFRNGEGGQAHRFASLWFAELVRSSHSESGRCRLPTVGTASAPGSGNCEREDGPGVDHVRGAPRGVARVFVAARTIVWLLKRRVSIGGDVSAADRRQRVLDGQIGR